MASSYRARTGINYIPVGGGREVRAERDDIVDDIPEKLARRWVKEQVLAPAPHVYDATEVSS